MRVRLCASFVLVKVVPSSGLFVLDRVALLPYSKLHLPHVLKRGTDHHSCLREGSVGLLFYLHS